MASTQQAAVMSTIGFLGAATPTVASHWFATFVQRLRDLGWIEGRNVTIEVRWAESVTTEPQRSRPSSPG